MTLSLFGAAVVPSLLILWYFRNRDLHPEPRSVVMRTFWYGVVIGATSEDAGFDKRVTAGGLLHLLAMATSVVPALAGGDLRGHWAGLRPMAADGLPLLGPHPQVEGLFVATGHHRNGILLAPATAQLVAQSVLQAETSLDLSPFLPG